MKAYKLSGWPELPAPYHRTAYRRMLHEMSQRYASINQLMHASGLGRPAVKEFVEKLAARGMLVEREQQEPDSLFGSLGPWIRRALNTADPR